MSKKRTEETILKKFIKDYLNYQNWFHFHIFQSLGSYPGLPDMVAIKGKNILFIEVKSKRGIQSENQKKFQENVEKYAEENVKYMLIKDPDEFVEKMNFINKNKDMLFI